MVLLHTDIPSRRQVDQLIGIRHPASVSIYLATDPASTGDVERLELKNQTSEASRRLLASGIDKREVAEVEESLQSLDDDPQLWRYLARSLAIFATPDSLVTFRLPNELSPRLQVADRFALKPLLRSITFPQAAYVLALAQNSVRLLQVLPDGSPQEIDVPALPTDIASAIGVESIRGRSPRGKLQGSEGQKVRMNQYVRRVDEALRPVLHEDVPLVLAATEPLASLYRLASTAPQLAPTTLRGNPEAMSDQDLAAEARSVLDETYDAQVDQIKELYGRRAAEGRGSTDVAGVARAATYGMVDTILVDIDQAIPGTVDDESGELTFADADSEGAAGYGVIDEIANRVWLAGGTVLAVRSHNIPGGGPLAAILRYAPTSG